MHFLNALNDFVFPSVCLSCGDALSVRDRYLCDSCILHRFEDASPFDPIHLPVRIQSCYAMWQFDKNETLQHLMHLLKYQSIPQAGVELGCELGRKWMDFQRRSRWSDSEGNEVGSEGSSEGWESVGERKTLYEMDSDDCIIKQDELVYLLPVPLHPSRFRKRGYNQAEKIAEGVAEVTGYEVCPSDAVVRVRNTTSQTGLRIRQRERNIKNAFEVRRPDLIRNRCILIVDDVYTTGATTFELSSALESHEPARIHILTVALA